MADKRLWAGIDVGKEHHWVTVVDGSGSVVFSRKLANDEQPIRQAISEIDRQFGALLKQLPNRSEMESLLADINQAGLGRGLQFELFKPGTEVMKDFYAELPINVRLTGSYHDFGAFAGDISRLSRIVTLNNIAIALNPQAKDGSLVMDAVTKTFRYLDDEELAAKKKAAQAAKGGKK